MSSLILRTLEEVINVVQPSPQEELQMYIWMFEFLQDPKLFKAKRRLIKRMNQNKNKDNNMNLMLNFCTTIITSGPRKGEMCGKPNKPNHKYCFLHQKELNLSDNSDDENTLSSSSSSSSSSSRIRKGKTDINMNMNDINTENDINSSKTKSKSKLEYKEINMSQSHISQETEKKIGTQDMILYPNRFKNFLYPDTKLIIDKDHKVVAREGKTGEWLPLEPEDIRTVKRLRLRYKIIDLSFKGETKPNKVNGD